MVPISAITVLVVLGVIPWDGMLIFLLFLASLIISLGGLVLATLTLEWLRIAIEGDKEEP